jgi:Zn-dependent peptidase ImmA (M78 family)
MHVYRARGDLRSGFPDRFQELRAALHPSPSLHEDLKQPELRWSQLQFLSFTAAHEYAHWIIRDIQVEAFSYSGGTEDLLEVRANAFAAAFLMPPEGTRRYFEEMGLLRDERIERLSVADIVYAMNYFGVSRPALLYRLGNLGLLTEDQRDEAIALEFSVTNVSRKLGIRMREYREVDARFRLLVREAWRRGAITTGRAADLLDLDIEDFRERMRSLQEQVIAPDEAVPLVGASAAG